MILLLKATHTNDFDPNRQIGNVFSYGKWVWYYHRGVNIFIVRKFKTKNVFLNHYNRNIKKLMWKQKLCTSSHYYQEF